MRLLAILVAVAGCARPLPIEPAVAPRVVFAPLATPAPHQVRGYGPADAVLHDPPLLDLRDLAPSLWALAPLELEPSLPDVHAAWPGVCERRGRMSDDELAYVEAWCLAKDRAGTIAALAKLFDTGVGLAAQRDAIVLVEATAGSADEARRTVDAMAIDPITAHDWLAYALLADGHEREARALATELPAWTHAGCTFALRDALGAADRELAGTLAAARRTPCARDAVRIAAAMAGPLRAAILAGVLADWGGADWFALARRATSAMPVPGAEHTAITALANALRTTCEPAAVDRVAAFAAALQARPDRDRSLDDLLAEFVPADRARERCWHP